uniref:sperm-associated antigen 16 protein n=1 Tax=Doryrhamphus excisus TaxID=161450 RepID=UPI0025AE31F3|nr:sperm-associated antigen 16 protein [Doryrhamphus excisus]
MSAQSKEKEDEDFKLEAGTSSTAGPSREGAVEDIPETVDDFLRNFLHRLGLRRTQDSFEVEWYGWAHKVLTEPLSMAPPAAGVLFLPDAITHKQLLETELENVLMDTKRFKQDVLSARDSLVRMQRDRDLHQLHHRRCLEDTKHLLEDIKRLKKRLESYEPVLRHLDDKYQATLRQKMLLSLESQRLLNTSEAKLSQDQSKTEKSGKKRSGTPRHPKDSEIPVYGRRFHGQHPQYKRAHSFSLLGSIKAHHLPISSISLHPQKNILASASDDCSWRLWMLPASREKVAQMVLTGEGHSDWLSGCSFHPEGTKLATTSGDATVRLWDFSCGRCVLTLSGHSRPTWGCSFHSCGDFLASCSSDKTAKLWDLNSQRCRLTMRRHSASVNSVCFQHLSNNVLTSSADKSVALWDIRLGVCTASFHGHQHPCNHATFGLAEEVMASCDTRGTVNVWDIRTPASPVRTIDTGPLSANQVALSPSGKILAVASSDGLVRLVDVDSYVVWKLLGHKDSVNTIIFDHKGETVMSAGSDGLINVCM